MKGGILAILSLVFGMSLMVSSCTPEVQKDPLIGHWRVFYVNRGGTILGGQKFRGTAYTFRDNGTVFAESHQGDTMTSRYVHENETLKYIGSGVEEAYHVDTLSKGRLVISADIDGIPTEIRMLKEL